MGYTVEDLLSLFVSPPLWVKDCPTIFVLKLNYLEDILILISYQTWIWSNRCTSSRKWFWRLLMHAWTEFFVVKAIFSDWLIKSNIITIRPFHHFETSFLNLRTILSKYYGIYYLFRLIWVNILVLLLILKCFRFS